MNANKEVEYIAEIVMLKSALGVLNGESEPRLSLINKLLEVHSKVNGDCRYRLRDVERIEQFSVRTGESKSIIIWGPEITATKEVNVL